MFSFSTVQCRAAPVEAKADRTFTKRWGSKPDLFGKGYLPLPTHFLELYSSGSLPSHPCLEDGKPSSDLELFGLWKRCLGPLSFGRRMRRTPTHLTLTLYRVEG